MKCNRLKRDYMPRQKESDKKTLKINMQGKEVDAVRVGIKKSTEEWSTYILENGTTLKFKAVVSEVFKATEERDPITGEPLYMSKSHNILKIEG